MRRGAGKAKGGEFERLVCKELSVWVTKGARDDVFWRSAMSGGRATVRKAQGKSSPHVGGDICAVHTAGHDFIDRFYVECKFYADLQLHHVAMGSGGNLLNFWNVARKQAKMHRKLPMLVAKQNRVPPLLVLSHAGVQALHAGELVLSISCQHDACLCLWSFVRESIDLEAVLKAMPPVDIRPRIKIPINRPIKVGGIGPQWE